MVKIKKGDFVEIDYIGRVKESDKIFDLTNEEVAKENSIHDKEMKYGAIVICVGENQILKGVDTALEGKEVGEKFKVDISPEDGFGKKNPKLLKIVNTNVFLKQKINPMPGLQVNLDGMFGVIRTVSGGRTIVDFNHPLAGRDLNYEIEIKKLVTDVNEKIKGLGIEDFKFSEGKLEINLKKELKKEEKEGVTERIKTLIKEVKGISFKVVNKK